MIYSDIFDILVTHTYDIFWNKGVLSKQSTDQCFWKKCHSNDSLDPERVKPIGNPTGTVFPFFFQPPIEHERPFKGTAIASTSDT